MRYTWLIALIVSSSGLGVSGCRQEMGEQPYYRPLEPSHLFADGKSARHPPEGTVALGTLNLDVEFYQGKKFPTREGLFMAAMVEPDGKAPVEPSLEQIGRIPYVEAFPVAVDRELLLRGKTQYTVFCAVCHGGTGTGQGPVVERGFTAPPTYHSDRLRQAPPGYFFDVMTHGLGSMPDYREQVPPGDRWAIAAYIEVLQLSRHVSLDDLPRETREEVHRKLEAEVD